MPKGKRDKPSAIKVIRQSQHELDVEMEPQAVIGRALRFFTMRVYKDIDDLDEYDYAAFCINNSHHFSLRHYRHDPGKVTSLYTEAMDEPSAVELVRSACRAFGIEDSLLHWIRGRAFQYGRLEPLAHELREREARDIVLKAAACFPGRIATTSEIKDFVEKIVEFSPADLEPYPSRPSEPRWRQRIGNVVSHANSSQSIFRQRFAVQTAADRIKVTAKGVSYLKSIGFSCPDADL